MSFYERRNKEEEALKSYLEQSQKYFQNTNYIDALKYANKAIALSKNDPYSFESKLASIFTAKSLLEIGLIKEALNYLQVTENNNSKFPNSKIQVEIHRLRGRAYGLLNLYDEAINEFRNQEKYSNNLDNEQEKLISKFWSYQNIGEVYHKNHLNDSVWHYLHKQQELLPLIKNESSFYHEAYTFNKIGALYTEEGKLSKADYFLNKALDILEKNKAPLQFDVYLSLAHLEEARHNLPQALKYYEKALKNTEELQDRDATYEIYQALGEFYLEHDLDSTKTKEYLLKGKELGKELNAANKKAMEIALAQLINNKKKESQKSSYLIISIFTCCVLLSAIVLFYFIRRNRRKNLQLQKDKEHYLQTIEQLHKTLNEDAKEQKFQHLLNLAKNNSPEFLIVFKELYPDFIQKLKSYDPNIRSSQMTFLALTFLNFSTKDIAEYTFVTVRAVQVRKNRLRKKYNIPSNCDFNSYMRNFAYTQD